MIEPEPDYSVEYASLNKYETWKINGIHHNINGPAYVESMKNDNGDYVKCREIYIINGKTVSERLFYTTGELFYEINNMYADYYINNTEPFQIFYRQNGSVSQKRYMYQQKIKIEQYDENENLVKNQ